MLSAVADRIACREVLRRPPTASDNEETSGGTSLGEGIGLLRMGLLELHSSEQANTADGTMFQRLGASPPRTDADLAWCHRYMRRVMIKAADRTQQPIARRSGQRRMWMTRPPAYRQALIWVLLETVPSKDFLRAERDIYALVTDGSDWDFLRELSVRSPQPVAARAAGLLQARRLLLFL